MSLFSAASIGRDQDEHIDDKPWMAILTAGVGVALVAIVAVVITQHRHYRRKLRLQSDAENSAEHLIFPRINIPDQSAMHAKYDSQPGPSSRIWP